MKRKNSIILVVTMLTSLVFTGCISSGQSQMNSLNENLQKSKAPIRYVRTKSDSVEMYKEEWAGRPGKSITLNSKILENDVLKLIEEHCGLKKSQLIETRVVSHNPPDFYEVWVFQDPLSKRDDRTSGLAITFKDLGPNQGTDFNVNGNCHGKASMQFIFGK